MGPKFGLRLKIGGTQTGTETNRYQNATFSWVRANGGIINGGVACVCAKWRVFVHFCAFLRFSVRFFLLPKWPAEKRKIAHNRAKMCKKRFYAIPPLVILVTHAIAITNR